MAFRQQKVLFLRKYQAEKKLLLQNGSQKHGKSVW